MLKFTSEEKHSVLQAPSLQHWFKNWQTLRKQKLTASTFAAAIGFWRRRRSQLWLEKIGAIEPFSGNLATCWGNIKEEEALERYKLITGNAVLFPEFQVYTAKPEDSWLAASPDGIIDRLVYELPPHGVLEVKCPYFSGDMSKAFPWSRIPVHYIPQAQGLMEILGRDWMDFYVWTVNGSSLFRLHRDEEYWDSEIISDPKCESNFSSLWCTRYKTFHMPSAQLKLFGGRKMLDCDLHLYSTVTISAHRNLFFVSCSLARDEEKKMQAEAEISTD
ncbi:hypothetical protein TSUD_414450 [Trifolium subterraneum]|uniref:YqaJ viral recombinase domain-containing protein n=1 Tax=Trifolium subterraneum TaxID=3900 RepID=A0A2Z6P9D5_TRISU|nr:hypothetical protein TSUD_414450 [Trifolium subterraneum]